MSADNEVLVLRAAGVNIYHLLWPALALGIGTTAATAALYYDTIPRSQQLLQAQFENDAEDILYGMLKREGGLRQANLDYVLFVRDVQGRDLIDVVIKKRNRQADRQADDRQGQYEMVARAQTAKIRVRRVADARPESADPANKVNLSAVRALEIEADRRGRAATRRSWSSTWTAATWTRSRATRPPSCTGRNTPPRCRVRSSASRPRTGRVPRPGTSCSPTWSRPARTTPT